MKIHIVSGFLGAGKTTFLNRYIPTLAGKVVVIENEFGDVGVDPALIEPSVPVHELYAGCICCTLAGELQAGIQMIYEQYRPDHIVLEPSGVGKLSDVINACYLAQRVEGLELAIARLIVLVDASECAAYLEDFGEFYKNQIAYARLILLSHSSDLEEDAKARTLELIRACNREAVLYTEDWRMLSDEELSELVSLSAEYGKLMLKRDAAGLPADQVFASFTIPIDADLTQAELLVRLHALTDRKFGAVLRVKGFARLADGAVLVQYSNGRTEVSEAQREFARSELVVIGANLDRLRIEEMWRVR